MNEDNRCCASLAKALPLQEVKHNSLPKDALTGTAENGDGCSIDVLLANPSCGLPEVTDGETILCLGPACIEELFALSRVVGPRGRVIAMEANDERLAAVRQRCQEFSTRAGIGNVHVLKGNEQDLSLNLERLDDLLRDQPVNSANDWVAMQKRCIALRCDETLIPSASVDVVCCQGDVKTRSREEWRQMLSEIYRVLRRSGRVVLSELVSDEPLPTRFSPTNSLEPRHEDDVMNSAFVENEFLEAFEEAGFHGIEILSRDVSPWKVVKDIELRHLTVRAFKGKEGPCRDHNQAVIYRGPWKCVTDDDGHVLRRGVRTAVCEKTFAIYSAAPYQDQIIPVLPNVPVSPADALPYDCRRSVIRSPRETKAKQAAKPLFSIASNCNSDDCC